MGFISLSLGIMSKKSQKANHIKLPKWAINIRITIVEPKV